VRRGAAFTCGASITGCWCLKVELDDQARAAFVRSTRAASAASAWRPPWVIRKRTR